MLNFKEINMFCPSVKVIPILAISFVEVRTLIHQDKYISIFMTPFSQAKKQQKNNLLIHRKTFLCQ